MPNGITSVKALMTRIEPFKSSPLGFFKPTTLVTAKINTVIVQTTKLDKKTEDIDINANLPGSSVFAAAAAIGAEPRPASFEDIPLAIPI